MLEEFIVVLAYSKRTQFAFIFGLIFGLTVWLAGEYMVARIAFEGPLAPLAEVVREKLSNRYDKAALLCFFGFFALAVKSYLRDRKRLLEL